MELDPRIAAFVGGHLGIKIADATLAVMRTSRAEAVERLAELSKRDLGNMPWIIYLNGSGLGLGVTMARNGKDFDEFFDVPVHTATRMPRTVADALMAYAVREGLLETPRGKLLRVMDVREALTVCIAAIDTEIRNIEKAKAEVVAYLGELPKVKP